jgi:hypothetical protein
LIAGFNNIAMISKAVVSLESPNTLLYAEKLRFVVMITLVRS